MKEFDMVGMRTIGNVELLQKPHARIGVFASRQLDSVGSIVKEQWAVAKGRQRKCIVGTFHSCSRCCPRQVGGMLLIFLVFKPRGPVNGPVNGPLNQVSFFHLKNRAFIFWA